MKFILCLIFIFSIIFGFVSPRCGAVCDEDLSKPCENLFRGECDAMESCFWSNEVRRCVQRGFY
jgi:hypothetical protein